MPIVASTLSSPSRQSKTYASAIVSGSIPPTSVVTPSTSPASERTLVTTSGTGEAASASPAAATNGV